MYDGINRFLNKNTQMEYDFIMCIYWLNKLPKPSKLNGKKYNYL